MGCIHVKKIKPDSKIEDINFNRVSQMKVQEEMSEKKLNFWSWKSYNLQTFSRIAKISMHKHIQHV